MFVNSMLHSESNVKPSGAVYRLMKKHQCVYPF